MRFSCPRRWSWESGEKGKRRPYLPDDKQFLVTRNIPCLCRAKDLLKGKMEEELLQLQEGEAEADAWVATGGSTAAGGVEDEIADMSLADDPAEGAEGSGSAVPEGQAASASTPQADDAESDSDDVPDMEDFVVEEEDDTVTIHHPSSNREGERESQAGEENKILRTRTYDISVTYDKYYQTPRFWLVGYDETRQLLKPELALGEPPPPPHTHTHTHTHLLLTFLYLVSARPHRNPNSAEDVSAEHAEKTVTIDTHPHLPLSSASIHPCKHAHVMKKLLDSLSEGGKEPSVEHYLVIFLKFIASIVPTIDYDYTMAADIGGS